MRAVLEQRIGNGDNRGDGEVDRLRDRRAAEGGSAVGGERPDVGREGDGREGGAAVERAGRNGRKAGRREGGQRRTTGEDRLRERRRGGGQDERAGGHGLRGKPEFGKRGAPLEGARADVVPGERAGQDARRESRAVAERVRADGVRAGGELHGRELRAVRERAGQQAREREVRVILDLAEVQRHRVRARRGDAAGEVAAGAVRDELQRPVAVLAFDRDNAVAVRPDRLPVGVALRKVLLHEPVPPAGLVHAERGLAERLRTRIGGLGQQRRVVLDRCESVRRPARALLRVDIKHVVATGILRRKAIAPQGCRRFAEEAEADDGRAAVLLLAKRIVPKSYEGGGKDDAFAFCQFDAIEGIGGDGRERRGRKVEVVVERYLPKGALPDVHGQIQIGRKQRCQGAAHIERAVVISARHGIQTFGENDVRYP